MGNPHLPTKWNKDVVGAWRLDLPIDIKDTDNESDGETSKGDSEVEMSDDDRDGSSSSDCISTTISD
jgi:hypothetical protein